MKKVKCMGGGKPPVKVKNIVKFKSHQSNIAGSCTIMVSQKI